MKEEGWRKDKDWLCNISVETNATVNIKLTYNILLSSFKSTSSYNIMCVNAISTNIIFVKVRTRGRGDRKGHYIIEKNIAYLLYLTSYLRIDSINHIIKNWKNRDIPTNDYKSLAVSTANDLYLKCVEGILDVDWKMEISGGLTHLPWYSISVDILVQTINLSYSGGSKMKTVTKINHK